MARGISILLKVLAAIAAIAAIVSCFAALLVVPEFRDLFNLGKKSAQPTQFIVPTSITSPLDGVEGEYKTTLLRVISLGTNCYTHPSGYCGLDIRVEWENVQPNSGLIYTIGYAPYYNPPLWWIAGVGIEAIGSSQYVNDNGAYGNPGDDLFVYACLTTQDYNSGDEFYAPPFCDVTSEMVSIEPK